MLLAAVSALRRLCCADGGGGDVNPPGSRRTGRCCAARVTRPVYPVPPTRAPAPTHPHPHPHPRRWRRARGRPSARISTRRARARRRGRGGRWRTGWSGTQSPSTCVRRSVFCCCARVLRNGSRPPLFAIDLRRAVLSRAALALTLSPRPPCARAEHPLLGHDRPAAGAEPPRAARGARVFPHCGVCRL